MQLASAAPVDVTVTITRLIETNSADPSPPGDHYAVVDINNLGVQAGPIDEPCPFGSGCIIDFPYTIAPEWKFTRTVDSALSSIPIVIRIQESDAFSDDVIDVNPTAGKTQLDLTFDLNAATWSGDVPNNIGFSQGPSDGTHDEDGSAKVFFDISIGDGDTDDDGIPDGVERFGLLDSNGNVLGNTIAFGFPMDPCRKTVAVEVDFLNVPGAGGHSHQPSNQAMNQAVASFNSAPVQAVASCPYPGFPIQSSGVNLVIDVDDAIVETNQFLTMNNALAGVTSLDAVKFANFDQARRPYFHYSLWGHDQPVCPQPPPPAIPTTCPNPTAYARSGSSGSGEGGPDSSGVLRGGNDFIVTLSTFSGQVNGADSDQVGTFMHELGHNLGLGHGGNQVEPFNCKPNYLSVMNYAFQLVGIPDPNVGPPPVGSGIPASRFDYSGQSLQLLQELALSENAGISDGTDFTTWSATIAGAGGPVVVQAWGQGNGPLSWDQDAAGVIADAPGNPSPQTVQVDINNLQIRGCGLAFTTGNPIPSPGQGLSGFNDWSGLDYQFRDDPDFAAGAHSTVHPNPDLTDEDAQKIRDSMNAFFSPDLNVEKQVSTGNAVPGEILTYDVIVSNIGTGQAKDVVLVEESPDGASSTLSLHDLKPDESTTMTFSFAVPFPIADGSILTNTATVSGNNLLGYSSEDLRNNVASASTIVHTPVLELDKFAGSIVNAGAAITYVITYQNVGTAPAEDVVITDTLPSSMYYSLVLDTGAGPKPNSVIENADGTTTLRWTIGDIAAQSSLLTVEYKARPSLLLFGGTTITNNASLDFTDVNSNDYPAVTTSFTARISSAVPDKDPQSKNFWRIHNEFWTDEALARIQATDQRFDITPANSILQQSEILATVSAHGHQVSDLKSQLLASYFNLAFRHVDADNQIESKLASQLGVNNVKDAIVYAQNTLTLPLNNVTKDRYGDVIRLLDEINKNKSEVY